MREYIAQYYPPETEESNQENLDLFFNFMNERHNIWHKRFVEKLTPPWTEDPILKVTKYTNIYRELDRGTLWWLENIGKQYLISKFAWVNKPLPDSNEDIFKYHISSHNIEVTTGFKNLIWKTVIYRLCNRIETFEEVGFPEYDTYDRHNINNPYWEKLHIIELRGQSVMTSAHLTCPTPSGYSKVEGFIMAVNSLHENLDNLCKEIPKCKNSKQVFEELRVVHCVGNFIAYEVLCDLMYVNAIGIDACTDPETNSWERQDFKEDDWANVGPGAYQGIRLIYPSSAVGRNKSKTVYNRMLQLRDEQHQHFERLGIKFKFYERFTKGHLSLRSIEHSLCEFSKYWLQRHSLGKQRLKFKPDSHASKVIDGDKIRK